MSIGIFRNTFRACSLTARYLIAMATALALFAAGCEHKEIAPPAETAEIRVLFEWGNASDADVQGMTLYFYPTDIGGNTTGKIWRFDIAGSHGGTLEIPPGKYRVISLNNDVAGIRTVDAALSSTLSATAAGTSQDNGYPAFGMLYGAVIKELEITPCCVKYTTPGGTVKECEKRLVRCSPDSIATRFAIRLNDVTGLQRVKNAQATLKYVKPALLLETHEPQGNDTGVHLPMTIDLTARKMTGAGSAFAIAKMQSLPLSLLITITLTDGKTITRHCSLTPDDINILSSHNVVISIDGIDIPDDSGSNDDDLDGIDASVDGWETINIDLVTDADRR